MARRWLRYEPASASSDAVADSEKLNTFKRVEGILFKIPKIKRSKKSP